MGMTIFSSGAACALLLASTTAIAQTAASDTPADYTHAVPLTVSGKNALASVRLPPPIYLNSRSARLADLRMFDATGKALPFALIQPWGQSDSSRKQIAAKIFPAPPVSRTATQINSDIEIKTTADGSVTSVTTRHNPRAGAAASDMGALILDLGAAQGAIDALVFTLPDGMDNYQADVALEASKDLRDWEEAGSASLSWLSNANRETLSSNRMSIDARSFRYARLTWRQGTPLQFASIVAESPVSTEVAPAIDSVVLQAKPGKFAGDLAYDAAPAIPVQRISVQFAAQNVVMPAQLGEYVELPTVKGDSATRWDFRPRMQATFFKLTQDGKLRQGGDIALDEAHVSRWVLRPLQAASAQPTLRLSWTPASAVFMASGSPPYTLYVGRDKAEAANQDVAAVAPGFSAAELQALEQATVGQVRVSGIKASVASDAEAAGKAARWRVMLLWGVLLLGVAVLGAMVWKLMGQMNKPE